MTNEEAFKSWFDNQIWGNESWEDGLREAWQAAIAYMQEQNKSEVTGLAVDVIEKYIED